MVLLNSPRRCFLLSLLIVLLVLANNAGRQAERLVEADLPNPDSYYKLVLLRDAEPLRGWAWSARDNAPHGFWMHWSEPHSQTMRAMTDALAWFSLPPERAMLWAGGALTLLSMLLVMWPILLLLYRQGARLPSVLVAIAFATSMPLFGYGQLLQITHHIFMLVPLAWALLSLHGKPSLWRDARAGALLAFALWISPETMPFVLVISALRAAQRLIEPTSQALWAWAFALAAFASAAWCVNPPAPTYGAWTLDHMSLAWLFFAALVAALMLTIDVIARYRVVTRWGISATLFGVAALLWLALVPEAKHGAIGLLPDDLRVHWWARIHELKAVSTSAQWLAYSCLPVLAALLCFAVAWRQRCLWFALLALAIVAYGALGLMHIRMGAAAALLSCYGLALALQNLPAFRLPSNDLSRRQQALVLVVIGILPGHVYVAGALEQTQTTSASCELAPAAQALNTLAPGTVLLPLNDAPELLYRTHHRVIAGNYHHNIDGLSDYFAFWLGRDIEPVIVRRQVRYVLLCEASAEPSAAVRRELRQYFSVVQTLPGGWLLMSRSATPMAPH